jgi:hypothetical protein
MGCLAAGVTAAWVAAVATGALAEPISGPSYQRKSHATMGYHGGAHPGGPSHGRPPIESGHFQRPYPYHLDYYRMRYGGSYAPYFGNLYGPPQVVTAPYYGYYGHDYNGYGHGYGGYPPPHGRPGPPDAPVDDGKFDQTSDPP